MKKILFAVFSVLMLLSACSPAASDTSPSQGVKGINYRAELKAQPIEALGADFVAGINSFGLKSAGLLYNSEHNLAVSPVSLELALAMARMGAGGLTAEEMTKALGLSGLSDEDITAACRSLMWRANTGGMEAANSIWLDSSYPFSEDFVNTCTGDFMADAFPLEIPGAMDAINEWASEKTHGKIDGIIPQELDPLTKLVLCNALYFLGDWTVPFDANNTYDDEFASPSGKVKVSFMNDERSLPYYSDDKFSMISLSFKSEEGEGKYAMAFLLPAEGSDVAAMLSSLSAESFSAALSGMIEQQVDIKLPKFEYSFSTSFKQTLTSLGMNEAFKESADFSGMTGGDNELFIDDVLHKCYIKIDELGAEAAAVTAVMMETSAMPPEEIREFHADRPFVFAIYSQEDGAIAFLGAVNNPAQE
ncbi:MAG: serpin family protein [Burkholderiales bacterium]